jgi:dTDP-glucose 4,6-dehydratase
MKSGNKVFVTGADGFIGSHLTEALILEGYQVKAMVQYNSFNTCGWLDSIPDLIKKEVEIVSGDIRDSHGLITSVRGCNAILHLAALIAIPYSYHSPDVYIDTNVRGTLNVLQAAKINECSRIIHTSTSEVYGSAVYVPIDENHPIRGQSPYSASKIGADQLALSFNFSFGLPVVILRPFNTYGPRQSARAIIPTIVTQLASGAQTVKLGSLFPTRDLSFVSDTVRGFICCLKTPDIEGRVINLGSGFEISMGDLAKSIAEIMNVELRLETDPMRERPEQSEVSRLLANNAQARTILGWEPHYGGLEGLKRGLKETATWFCEKSNLSQYKANQYNI